MDYLIGGAEYLEKMKNFQLIGRNNELDHLSSILVRKKANSVLLVGPSGVGSSAIIVGLQELKSDVNVPFDIVSKRLFWLNTDDMFASGDTGVITKAFESAMNRLKSTIDPVMVIEDSGDFYEACRNAGTMHFINIINSAVKDGKIQVIFEVSDKDLTKILTWHSDMRETYTTMDVTEPVGVALEQIVKSAAVKLIAHHGIKIDEDAIDAAIELTNKYRVDAGLGLVQPSRAIALLDLTLASYRLKAHKEPPHIKRLMEEGKELESKQAQLEFLEDQTKIRDLHNRQRRYENSLAERIDQIYNIRAAEAAKNGVSVNAQTQLDPHFTGMAVDNPEIVKLLKEVELLKPEIENVRGQFETLAAKMNENLIITRREILIEFSRITGISVNKLGEDEKVILRNLESVLKSHVFGQDHVLVQLANAIKVSRVGRRNKNRPQASFLMMGPSGVGKTEVAKRVAEALQGDQKALLRFDMSEYMERHAVSKLIGAPPGYEGFEAGGILTNAMRINRNRIILFDEIEKAHPDVFNLFLQILDDGRLTDNVGRVADFSESIIVMTTNIGQPHFLNMELSFDVAEQMAKVDLDEQYRPEFLNRFNGRQNIVCFNRLELDSIERIVMREIHDLATSYTSLGVNVIVPEDDIKKFCAEQYDARTGARGLPGFINSNLEPQVTNFILDGKTGDMVFRYDAGKFVY